MQSFSQFEEREEARAINKIETNLSKEKIEFINAADTEETDYWKKVALKSIEERKKAVNKSGTAPGFFYPVKMQERIAL